MGALEYKPAVGPDYSKSEKLKVNSLRNLASDVLAKREDIHISADDQTMSQILQI